MFDISSETVTTGKEHGIMSNIDSSWMSLRPANSRASQKIELLPRFDVPPAVTNFGIETRPPHLPARNSPSRCCCLGVAVVLCCIGSYSTLSVAAGPVIQHGSKLARGLSTAMDTAISHANEQAEREAQRHYEARREYLRRKLESKELYERQRAPQLSPSVVTASIQRSTLLSNIAALRDVTSDTPKLDDMTVAKLFPDWIKDQDSNWVTQQVLRDLTLALAELSRSVNTRSEQVSDGMVEL